MPGPFHRDHPVIAAKTRMRKTETCSGCRPATGTTVSQLPEPRLQPVAKEPEPRCQASTEIAQVLVLSNRNPDCNTTAQKGQRPGVKPQVSTGAPPGTRTPNPRIKSPLLCQLS